MSFGSGMTMITLGISEDSKEEELQKEKVEREKEKVDKVEDSSDLEPKKRKRKRKENGQESPCKRCSTRSRKKLGDEEKQIMRTHHILHNPTCNRQLYLHHRMPPVSL